MTDQLSSNAARAHKREQASPRKDQRTPRQQQFDRDLAALGALLTADLQHSKSPPLAANDGADGQPAAPQGEEPGVRTAPSVRPRTAGRKAGAPRRPRRAPPPAQNLNDELRADRDSAPWMHRFEAELLREDDEPAFSRMLTGDPDEDLARTEPQFEARQPRPTPERNPLNGREPFYVKPDDRQAPIVRALRFGATAFSLLALVGVSALLVLLVAGGDRAATPVAERAAPAGQPVAAVDDATVSPPASASGAAPVVIASTGLKQDTSRIPAEEDAAPIPVQEVAAARGSGTVRPVDANSASAFAAETAVSPPADDPAPAATPEFAPSGMDAVPAAGAIDAPTEVASITEAPGAEPAQDVQPAEAAAESPARSAAVTSDVNMRAGPDNDAEVLAVVPAGNNVDVVECSRWCEVVYNDRQGFIHRRFVSDVN